MIVKSYVKDLAQRIAGKNVLDIGCCAATEANLLKRHNEYKKTAKTIIGVDINKTLLNAAITKKGAKNLHYLDMCDNVQVHKFAEQHGQFDTLVCTDVIEHVSNAGLFLDNIHKLMSKDGLLYITTPNMRSVRWFMMFVRNKVKINFDHVCWYDEFTLSVMLKRHGFKVNETLFHSEEIQDARQLKLPYKPWMCRRLYMIISKE